MLTQLKLAIFIKQNTEQNTKCELKKFVTINQMKQERQYALSNTKEDLI